MIACLLLLLQLAAAPVFYPETIDSLWDSTHTTVQLQGTVAVVSTTPDRNGKPIISFMLGDRHGHFIRCVLPHDEPQNGPTPYVDQPRVGLTVIVFGTRVKYSVEERGQGVVEIDRVAKIVLVVEP